jgi:hypothetical protein
VGAISEIVMRTADSISDLTSCNAVSNITNMSTRKLLELTRQLTVDVIRIFSLCEVPLVRNHGGKPRYLLAFRPSFESRLALKWQVKASPSVRNCAHTASNTSSRARFPRVGVVNRCS